MVKCRREAWSPVRSCSTNELACSRLEICFFPWFLDNAASMILIGRMPILYLSFCTACIPINAAYCIKVIKVNNSEDVPQQSKGSRDFQGNGEASNPLGWSRLPDAATACEPSAAMALARTLISSSWQGIMNVNELDRGFHSHGGTPRAGWFITMMVI